MTLVMSDQHLFVMRHLHVCFIGRKDTLQPKNVILAWLHR